MCGIAGEINFRTKINNEIIREMSRALTPRGPDADGLFEHEHVWRTGGLSSLIPITALSL